MILSEQQKAIINADADSMCIIACAGSGKTETAIHRLAKLRNDMINHRGYIVLLSFTNIAIKTFKEGYSSLIKNNVEGFKNRVFIETLDSFITSNILRPHSYHQMNCKVTPFLISGSESFLNNRSLAYWYETPTGEKRSVPPSDINNVTIGIEDGKIVFLYKINNEFCFINNGPKITKLLGSYGAYTHELGKYWVLLTLLNNKKLLHAIVNRFPIIIVDEAQDIDFMHSLILKILHNAGVKLTLIGDPHQAIYEFSGADGKFISSFSKEINNRFSLSINYRSIPSIVSTASLISKRDDKSHRKQQNTNHGVYYVLYDKNNPQNTIDNFISRVNFMGLNIQNSAVLYRSWSGIHKLSGIVELGQGKMKLLALATIKRDKNKNYKEAFDLVLSCISGLFNSLSNNFIKQVNCESEYLGLKRMIWEFVRDPSIGLPSGNLSAKTEWYSITKARIINLLNEIKNVYGYELHDNIGRILSSRKLPENALITDTDVLENGIKQTIRIDTVHQAKGESLDAVLYMPTEKKHLREMMNGTETELGRIGYVALTRAKNFFVIGIEQKWHSEFTQSLSKLNIIRLY